MPPTIPAARLLTTLEITKNVAKVMANQRGISPMITWRFTDRLKADRSRRGCISRCWAAGAMNIKRLIMAHTNITTYTALSSELTRV